MLLKAELRDKATKIVFCFFECNREGNTDIQPLHKMSYTEPENNEYAVTPSPLPPQLLNKVRGYGPRQIRELDHLL